RGKKAAMHDALKPVPVMFPNLSGSFNSMRAMHCPLPVSPDGKLYSLVMSDTASEPSAAFLGDAAPLRFGRNRKCGAATGRVSKPWTPQMMFLSTVGIVMAH